jgi:hypothetical protein
MPNGTNYTRTKGDALETGEPWNVMQPKGFLKENYWKLTDKVFHSFQQIHNDFEEYDWYLKGIIKQLVVTLIAMWL